MNYQSRSRFFMYMATRTTMSSTANCHETPNSTSLCDLNAKAFLQEQISSNAPAPMSFPDERCTISINSKRATTDVGEMVRHAVTMRNFRQSRAVGHFDTTEGFDAVDWKAVASTMHTFPQQFQLWITKHVSGCNASNKLQVHLGRADTNLCPI